MGEEGRIPVIGITGGIGAGKSEILRYAQSTYRCRVMYADEVARDLEKPGGSCYAAVVHVLENVPQVKEPLLRDDGTIRNPEMAARIFRDPGTLERINGIVHPAVKQVILNAIDETCREKSADVFFVEAALLIEAGYRGILDRLWYIYCDESIRKERLKASRGYSDEKTDRIMANQLTDSVFRENADAVIDNSTLPENAFRKLDSLLSELGVKPDGSGRQEI